MVNAVGKDMALVKTAMMSATVTFLYFVGSVAIAIHRRDFHVPGGRAVDFEMEKPTLRVKAYFIKTRPAYSLSPSCGVTGRGVQYIIPPAVARARTENETNPY